MPTVQSSASGLRLRIPRAASTPRALLSVSEDGGGSADSVGNPNAPPPALDPTNALNPNGRVRKRVPGGMASFYDDSWGNILQSIKGGATTEQTLQSLLAGFKGNPGDLEDLMRQAGPFIASAEAGRMRNSDAMKYLGDQGNWDQGAMAGYGAAAGQIGQQGARQTQQGQNRLAAMGLGRGSARSALAQQGMQNSAAAQGNLWSQTYQQAQQNRWNSAMGLMDAHRMISQMALGQQITPREQGEGGMSGLQAGAMAAGGIGSLLGGLGALL